MKKISVSFEEKSDGKHQVIIKLHEIDNSIARLSPFINFSLKLKNMAAGEAALVQEEGLIKIHIYDIKDKTNASGAGEAVLNFLRSILDDKDCFTFKNHFRTNKAFEYIPKHPLKQSDSKAEHIATPPASASTSSTTASSAQPNKKQATPSPSFSTQNTSIPTGSRNPQIQIKTTQQWLQKQNDYQRTIIFEFQDAVDHEIKNNLFKVLRKLAMSNLGIVVKDDVRNPQLTTLKLEFMGNNKGATDSIINALQTMSSDNRERIQSLINAKRGFNGTLSLVPQPRAEASTASLEAPSGGEQKKGMSPNRESQP